MSNDRNRASELLDDASEVVSDRGRGATHGDMVEQHRKLAALWSAYLGADISPLDAAQMMIMVKMSRVAVGDTSERDHYLDQAGYAGISWAMIEAGHSHDGSR